MRSHRTIAAADESSRSGMRMVADGLFWQVTPAKFFAEWVKDPAGLQRVTHEVWQMTKLDLAKLQKAFAGK